MFSWVAFLIIHYCLHKYKRVKIKLWKITFLSLSFWADDKFLCNRIEISFIDPFSKQISIFFYHSVRNKREKKSSSTFMVLLTSIPKLNYAIWNVSMLSRRVQQSTVSLIPSRQKANENSQKSHLSLQNWMPLFFFVQCCKVFSRWGDDKSCKKEAF